MFDNIKEQIFSLIRIAIISATTSLVTKGVIDGSTQTIIVNSIIGLLTAAYAIWLRRANGVVASAAKVIAPTGGVIQTTAKQASEVPASNVVPKA